MSVVFDTKKIKKDFPIFENNPELVYLDNAATSQTPRQVLAAMEKYYTCYRSNIHRGGYGIAEMATERFENARQTLANFIGAQASEVVFTSGSTAGMNMLVAGLAEYLDIGSGDTIVSTMMEHHSSYLPLWNLARKNGAKLVRIGVMKDFGLDYEEAKRVITDGVKIVSIVLVSNVLGTINDVRLIADLAHRVGAIMIVDATEAVGHIPVNVRELACDFLVFSGHKMCGPTGIGVLYGKRDLLAKLEPNIMGGGIVESVGESDVVWREPPQRFEPGTQNIAGAIGLAAAAEYLTAIGVESIHEYVRGLLLYAVEEIERVLGVTIVGKRNPRENGGIIAFSVDDIHPHDIAEIVGRNGIALRAGYHCAEPLVKSLSLPAVTRASLYLYNDKTDLDILTASVREAVNFFSKR
ncbi:MAG: cysteine desulfurase [Candidatus Yonathbacteria bacterium CG_4_10_14_3_um_filter_47_65]|uniref:cysteine desulfurase n=2 Tax=Parcubacteria group TaxID=1794811 RepID=A0A2M8D6F6_9BACT|nr:MAG: hypothetical protein AUJ44_03880 [Candidatus Nomurabacteria bacterium CG1_02_47_685]PIP04036.1 MAG: cysteine desulfurase [Candidatus Yonathbacteria bacterium CG23_combo_of_CG06-09_8_20_14_all_46_18]PIQ32221.1 MAG: cysteine desulfurase [Candidatus Yonathbacteria bacterium CG17_big_fil_post_rev_8_21_14_2_50_46_19]PIX56684.1 MAG: cysteine desulfurase [Candidatus Yonathbacteria bacterium CG_4_10_14_3_um_filter_47_65]PIY57877.1 MAG: cysteine desulfurase [Candidatus Yonathbacteria bacterium C